jgi:hypothetical protein
MEKMKKQEAMWKSCRKRSCSKRDKVTFTSFDDCFDCGSALVIVKNQNRPHEEKHKEEEEDDNTPKGFRRTIGDYGHRASKFVSNFTKPADEWSCETDITGDCPILGDDKPVVRIPAQMFYDFVHMADKLDVEWLAYLKGAQNGLDWEIKEFYIPRQSVGGAHVDPIPETQEDMQPDTIGAIHSHVRMAAFWSTTDTDHMNHPVELVVNAHGDMKAMVRVKLECGRFVRKDAKIVLLHSTAEWRDQEVEKMRAKLIKIDKPFAGMSNFKGGFGEGWN